MTITPSVIEARDEIQVLLDDVVLRDDGSVEYRWTFTGTSAETGKSVRVPGYQGLAVARPDGSDNHVLFSNPPPWTD